MSPTATIARYVCPSASGRKMAPLSALSRSLRVTHDAVHHGREVERSTTCRVRLPPARSFRACARCVSSKSRAFSSATLIALASVCSRRTSDVGVRVLTVQVDQADETARLVTRRSAARTAPTSRACSVPGSRSMPKPRPAPPWFSLIDERLARAQARGRRSPCRRAVPDAIAMRFPCSSQYG